MLTCRSCNPDWFTNDGDIAVDRKCLRMGAPGLRGSGGGGGIEDSELHLFGTADGIDLTGSGGGGGISAERLDCT